MVSRRKILSRSRDDLNIEAPPPEEEEDIWYNKDKLYKVSQTIILVNNWRNHEWHWHGTTSTQSWWSLVILRTHWVLTNPKIMPCDCTEHTLGLFVLHCAGGILTRSRLSLGIQWFIPPGRIPSLVSSSQMVSEAFSACKMSKYSLPLMSKLSPPANNPLWHNVWWPWCLNLLGTSWQFDWGRS